MDKKNGQKNMDDNNKNETSIIRKARANPPSDDSAFASINQSEIEDLRTKIETYDTKIQEITSQLDGLKSENNKLHLEMKEMKKLQPNIISQLDGLKSENNKLIFELKEIENKLQFKIEDYRKRLEKKDQKYEPLPDYLKLKFEKLEAIESHLVSLLDVCQKIASSVNEQGEKLSNIETNVEKNGMSNEAAHRKLLKYFNNKGLIINVFVVLVAFFGYRMLRQKSL